MTAAKPINLNKARKASAKVENRRQADENAARFGRTKAQRDLEAAETRKMREVLDAHRHEK